MIPLDINDPDHKPEIIWGKYYYNRDKKRNSIYYIYTHNPGAFTEHDVAIFWGVKKNEVTKITEVDKTYELLVESWQQLGWIRKVSGGIQFGQLYWMSYFEPTPEGIKIAKEWKRNEKKEKHERRHNSHSKYNI